MKDLQEERNTCPACMATGMQIFYTVKQVPAHSVLLLTNQQAAIRYPTGDISLGFCPHCGFISNTLFDPTLNEYSANYEATQGYSSTFNAFQRRLAKKLVDRYQLHGKRVIEIGCGQGEFLSLLCEIGDNQGVGFDPAFNFQRLNAPLPEKLQIISDYYSEEYSGFSADLICCRMTLEHIHQVNAFLQTVHRATQGNPATRIFFQVPNVRYVLDTVAFWDIYYEHCSYFSPGSIARLFRNCGFEPLDIWTGYDNQYLMIDARPVLIDSQQTLPAEESLDVLSREVNAFAQRCSRNIVIWQERFHQWRQTAQKTVLWGGGSKSVAFLTTLGLGIDQVEYVVDINPHKKGTFIAGSGQKIVDPGYLTDYRPDTVIVMNPVYCEEIRTQLEQLNLSPRLVSVDSLLEEVAS